MKRRLLGLFFFFLICLAMFFGLNYLIDKISRHEDGWAKQVQQVEQADILAGRPSK